jgi:hypothetical protein
MAAPALKELYYAWVAEALDLGVTASWANRALTIGPDMGGGIGCSILLDHRNLRRFSP